jgi:RNA polymerase sigma factor for flagellar operon FliA
MKLPPGSGDLLTAEQEQATLEHLPIVGIIARRIHERLPQHVLIEDLYSAGMLGLLDAFGRFDPSKQVKFRTYAQFRIRSNTRQPADARLESSGLEAQGANG